MNCFFIVVLCLTLCNPMDCSTPGLYLPHHLPKFAQVHVHCIGDARPAISSSDTLFFCAQSFPVSGTFSVSCLFISGDQNTGASSLASVLPVNIQGCFPVRLTGLISLLSKGLSGVLSSTAFQRHRFFGLLPSLQSRSHSPT